MKKVMLITMIVAALLIGGCTESKRPVYAEGDLPAYYAEMFGNSNIARLNFLQTDLLNKHNAVIHGLDQTKDGKTTHLNGLVDLIGQLDARLKVLEAVDPNEATK